MTANCQETILRGEPSKQEKLQLIEQCLDFAICCIMFIKNIGDTAIKTKAKE